MDKMGTRIGRILSILGILVVVLVGIFAEGSWAQPPDIVSTTPGERSINVLTNVIITVQFSTSMDTNATEIDVEDEWDDDVLGTVQWATTSLPNDTLRFIPTNALKPATHYQAGGIGNSTGGESVWYGFSFITKHSTADTTPPTVQGVYPYNGMTGVPTVRSIDIEFSEAMNPWSVTTPGNITLTGPGISGTGDYSISYDFGEGGAEIKKNIPFSPSSTYTVAITTKVKDLRGNWLKDQYQWSFTTSADITPPTVTQTIPANNDTKVSIHPRFHVTFSEEMDENTLTTANISLYNNTAGTNVPIDIFDRDNYYVTFGPQSNLVNGHNYTVTIGTGVKDLSGNGLSAPYTWSFTVAEAGVDSDPVIEWGFGGDDVGIRWSDGTTLIELSLGASDDHTDRLTVTATTSSKNWTLTNRPGEENYEYNSTGNEGLSSGSHTVTFSVKDDASPQNTVTFQRDIFIFDSNPTLSSPFSGATGVSTTPTFQWSYGGTLRPFEYTPVIFDGPNPYTARAIWQGWMLDSGPVTYSISIPSDKALAPNTTYYWGVWGGNYDENGGVLSEIRSFTTGGTPPPLPSFSWVWVRSDDGPIGMQWNVGAKVVGPSPADIRELKVTGPGGFQYIFTEDDIFQGEFTGLFYWRSLTNPLANGTYTFTVTDSMGRTITETTSFTSAPVPRVDSSTMSPTNNSYLGTTTPTFSWGGVAGTGLSYRIHIFDWNGQEADIYYSSYIQETQFTIPSGYLLPNTPYKWRAEVFDSSQQNRSVSDTIGFSTGSYPYTLDIQGPTWSDNAYYSGQRRFFCALISGPLPPHITSLAVTGPGGFNHTFKESEIWWVRSIGNVYGYLEAGLPADGAYDYNIVDTFGGSDSFSKEQTSVVIPIVERSSMSPANNAYLDTLTPTFTWSAVEGSPRYYRISINDWKERYTVYQSLRSTDLFATVPAGVLKPERSYKWRVEVFDDPDGLVADNRSYSGWNCFTTTFNQQQYTLTVTKSGTGSGTVTSSPAGINCGDDCSERYSNIQKVKLTAKADANSTFAGWSGGGCSGTGTCTVTVDAVITVTASFALKVPDISVAQTTLDFGSVSVGKKITKTLKIANNGSGDLVITLSGLEGTDFSIQGSSSVTIKAKKSYSLKVLCTPISAGLKTATLSIVSNDPDTPTLEISLTATLPATTPDISVAQTSLDFGSIKVGKKVTKTLKITNNGSGDLVITLSGLEGTDFSIQGSSSVTIKSKKSYTLKIVYTPKSAGLETATLEITSNDPDTATINVALSGTGCDYESCTFPYAATIAEGRSAATEIMEKTGASSISLGFIDGDRLVWAETFGWADKASKTAPTADTMYPIGSVSKMLATIAVMKLVDQKQVSLDAPLTDYIKSFSMFSPEYTQITVRMLLNHSSGFPGTDYRNAETSSPLQFSYSSQVLETLKTQRLKHSPGYLSVYCNDGFTIIEQLVLARTGKSYAQFVQDEIFTPLGMTHSRYPLDYFPDGSFAKRHEGHTPLPQLFVNTYGSGGLYSTPTDMAKIAMMLIGGGWFGNERILSEASVAAMGADQTLTSFNPVKANTYSYGLGWDTVCQPGLGAVGVIGWQKGGDVPLGGSVMTIAPEEGLAVVVLGASGSFSSTKATIIAERILLMALAEKGRIATMPAPLTFSPRPEKTPTDELLNSAIGYYSNYTTFMRVQRQSNPLNFAKYDASKNDWTPWMTGLKLRDDDRFSSDADPSASFSFKTADGRQYLILRYPTGYGHYQDNLIYGQQVAATGVLPAAWNGRLGQKWLMTNEHPESSDKWASPLMQLPAVDNLLLADYWAGLQVVNPLFSDSRAGMILLIPQMYGTELNDVVIETRAGEEWIRFGSYLYRPQETIQALSNGTVSIGAEGLAEWRSLDATGITKTVTITPAVAGGRWKIYNSKFEKIETGEGTKSVTLSGGTYYLLFHNTATVNLA